MKTDAHMKQSQQLTATVMWNILYGNTLFAPVMNPADLALVVASLNGRRYCTTQGTLSMAGRQFKAIQHVNPDTTCIIAKD